MHIHTLNLSQACYYVLLGAGYDFSYYIYVLTRMQLVYDRDTFSLDDKMGDAEFEIGPFLEALRMRLDGDGLPSGTIITRVQPSRQNCLAEESCISWKDGRVVQDMVLRLRNVETGEIELQLKWIDIPGSRGLQH